MSDLVLNALRRNRAIAEKAGDTDWVKRIDARLAESNDAAVATDPVHPDVDAELEQLRLEAEAADIKVDRRWGVDRLREEIQAATESEENT